jgi:hypothetical protein
VTRSFAMASAFGLLLAAALAPGGTADQQKAIAAVKALGGQVSVEKAGKGAAVVTVSLGGCPVNDADLIHLKPLMALQTLDL